MGFLRRMASWHRHGRTKAIGAKPVFTRFDAVSPGRRCPGGFTIRPGSSTKLIDTFGENGSWTTLPAARSSLNQAIRITAATKHFAPCSSKGERRKTSPNNLAWPTARFGSGSTSSDSTASNRPTAPPFSRAESRTARWSHIGAEIGHDRTPRRRRSPRAHLVNGRAVAAEDARGGVVSVLAAVGAAQL
jgi:hypothetical protein